MLQATNMSSFNDNMMKIVGETKVLQDEHKQTKGQLKKMYDDLSKLQTTVTMLTQTKDVGHASTKRIASGSRN